MPLISLGLTQYLQLVVLYLKFSLQSVWCLTLPKVVFKALFFYLIILTQFLNSCFLLEGSKVLKVTVAV